MGEVITDVGIDLDGVIYPFADAFRDYCAERMGKLFLPEPTHWNFYEDWDLDHDTFQEWLIEASETHTVFATQKPFEGVVEAWAQLRAMGVKIHILTARPQSAWAQTAEWLTTHNLHVDSLHFGPSKAFLSKIAKDKAILIDDHVAYYEEVEKHGVIPVLMNRPWNSTKEGATRVNNLGEFVSLIRGYNLIKKHENKEPQPFVTKKYDPSKYAPLRKTPNYNERVVTPWLHHPEQSY